MNCSPTSSADPHQIITWSAVPGEIVGKMILMQPITAQGELEVLFEKEVLITQRQLAAKDPVVGTSA